MGGCGITTLRLRAFVRGIGANILKVVALLNCSVEIVAGRPKGFVFLVTGIIGAVECSM